MQIKRCFMPSYFRKVSKYSLKKLSDASESGYGQASYLLMRRGRLTAALVLYDGEHPKRNM